MFDRPAVIRLVAQLLEHATVEQVDTALREAVRERQPKPATTRAAAEAIVSARFPERSEA